MQNDIATSSLVIACFDGHGQFGHDVSKFCKVFMETTLVSHPLFLKDLHRAILDVTAQLGMLVRVRVRVYVLTFYDLMCSVHHSYSFFGKYNMVETEGRFVVNKHPLID